MSDASTDEWTEQKCIQLIHEFRARPSLWDPKHPLYFKKRTKAGTWEDIGQVLKVNPEACKRKMIVLMSSFRREKAKLINSISKQQTDKPVKNYTSTWFAFKEMVFMLDKETERKRQLSGLTEYDDVYPNIKMALLKQLPIKTETKKTAMDSTMPLRTRQPVRAETTTLDAIASSSKVLSDREEEIKFFTSFIGNKMKKYTDVTKNAVQQAMCHIIFQADQNYYESGVNKFPVIDKDPLEKIMFRDDADVNVKEQPLSDSD